jgi:hypothetical protein
MSEETPKYGSDSACERAIVLRLWAHGTEKEGRVCDAADEHYCYAATLLQLSPADAELLAAEYARAPGGFEQAAATSIRAALREREERIAQEDLEYAED